MASALETPKKKVSWTPTRKVTAGAAGGALATLIMAFLPSLGITMPTVPAGAETAMGVLATLVFSYWVPER